MAQTTSQKSTKGINYLAVSIGIIYLWFGILKFFPNVSPAEQLAKDTITMLTFGLIPANISIYLLAIWETVVGVCLILNIWKRPIILVALIHMICTFTPLIFFPHLSFTYAPTQLTLVGQYIIKNLIIIAALIRLKDEIH